jgi:hypothetical protein
MTLEYFSREDVANSLRNVLGKKNVSGKHVLVNGLCA